MKILSTEPTLRIVLQASGFLPDNLEDKLKSQSTSSQFGGEELPINWLNPFGAATKAPSETKSFQKRFVRRVHLQPRANETDLGIRIRGGIEYSLGVFISHIDTSSSAHLAGLMCTDQIIEVNGQSFSRISHQDAVLILKTSFLNYRTSKLPIKLTVRYLGKLPVYSHGQQESESQETPIRLGTTSGFVKFDDAFVLKKVFNENISRFQLFKYFLDEYVKGRVNIQHFMYLIFKHFGKNKNVVEGDFLHAFITQTDLKQFRLILDHKRSVQTDSNELNSRLLSDDFKKSLLVRSVECLNDLNVNKSTKTSKFDNWVHGSSGDQLGRKNNLQRNEFRKSMESLGLNLVDI